MENRPKIDFVNTIANPKSLGDQANVLRMQTNTDTVYPDFLEKPLLLTSDKFKTVAKLYNPDYIYRSVVLTDKNKDEHKLYWNIEMPEIECVSPKSTYNHDGTLKNIVVDESATKGKCLIRIKNRRWSIYIIRLNMAESLLYRSLFGFNLAPLSHE